MRLPSFAHTPAHTSSPTLPHRSPQTLSLDSSKVVNVTPRYAKTRDYSNRVFGWQNFELISDRPFETMLAEMKRLREEYPGRILIASIMEEYKWVGGGGAGREADGAGARGWERWVVRREEGR